MATYVYRCRKCRHEFEAKQAMSDKPLKYCPSCDTGLIDRVVQPACFTLKGDGYYGKGRA